MSAVRRAAGWLAACVAVVAIAACSTGMRLGYNNADMLLLYTLNGYLPLTTEQEQLVRERTGALVGWHRSTQLRDYAQLVEQARSALAAPVTAQQVLAFNDAVNARLATLGERAAPEVARLALTLTPEQLDKLQLKFADDAAKSRREEVKANGRSNGVEERVRKQVERTEYWLGSVTAEQKTLLRDALLARPDGGAWWIGERERRQQELLRLLRRVQSERPDEATATAWVRAYFAQLREPGEATRKAAMLTERQQNAALLAQLVNSATPEQRATLSRKLGTFAEDFIALAATRAANTPG